MKYLVLSIMYILVILMILVSVAYFTLLERKVLGYIQTRKGPNKVGFMGLLQPFSDGAKLFLKESGFLVFSNKKLYYISPMVGLWLSLLYWMIWPFNSGGVSLVMGVLYFVCLSSLGVYVLMGAGWGSNSSYALIGSYRGIAQMLSYEVSLVLILIGLSMVYGGYNMIGYMECGIWGGILMMVAPILLVWLVSIMAETNRSPFDFAEGESELVSGFNIEYGSVGFAMLFIMEYSNILFMSYFTAWLYFGGSKLVFMLIVFMFLWVRGSMPRMRYDHLMMMAWKCFLPLSLGYYMYLYNVVLLL